MAQYLIVPKSLAERFPRLGRAAQAVEAVALSAVFRVVGLLSPEWAVRIAGSLFALFGPLSQKASKAEKNLEIAFPETDAAWRRRSVRGIFRALGYSAAELVKLEQIWAEREHRLRFTIDDGAAAALAQRGPCLLVCAHVGPWQVYPFIARAAGLEYSTLYTPESNPRIAAAITRLRRGFGGGLLSSTGGARPLLRELQAGRSLAMAIDTRVTAGELIPFFGRDALTNTFAARLALRTGASLIPVHGYRTGGATYRIHALNPLRPSPACTAVAEQVRDLSLQLNRLFEDWISETPDQWICLKRRWPKAHKL